jgi:8-oxo-dGTP diphosphatase
MVKVVAALIELRGKLLVCQRKRGDRFELLWEFPGGKVEPGETLERALVREIYEELGVAAHVGPEVYRTVFQYRELPNQTEIVFFAASTQPEEVINFAFESLEWRELPTLGELEFLPADRDLVKQLASGALRIPTGWENSPRTANAPQEMA